MERITYLDLSGADLAFLPMELERLTAIEYLDLSNTGLINIDEVSKLRNLQELHIYNTRVEDLSPLYDLIHLKKVRITERNVPVDQVAQLRRKGIEIIDYGKYTSKLESKIVASLADQIKHVEFYSKGLSEEYVIELLHKGIEYSGIRIKKIAIDVGHPARSAIKKLPPEIEHCAYLEYLAIINSPIKDLSPVKNLNNLKEIYLYNTSVKDLSPLYGLDNLEKLEIMGRRVPYHQITYLKNKGVDVIKK